MDQVRSTRPASKSRSRWRALPRARLRAGLAVLLAFGSAGAAHASTVTLDWTAALTIPSSGTSSGVITATDTDANLPPVVNPSTYNATILASAATTYMLSADGIAVLPAPSTFAGLAISNGTLAPFSAGMPVTMSMLSVSGSPLTSYTVTLSGSGAGILPLATLESDVIALNSGIGNALKLFLTAAYPTSNEFLFNDTGTVTIMGTPTSISLAGSANAEAVVGSWKVQAVPLPASLWLLASGFAAITGFARRRTNIAAASHA